MQRTRRLATALVGAGAITTAASAQTTPPDVADLVGARAAGAEAALTSRGYVNTGGRTGDDRKWTYWWNARRGACLSVVTRDGRYDSIVATPAPDCGQDGRTATRPEPAFPSDGDDYREHVALLCYGEGEKLTNEPRRASNGIATSGAMYRGPASN